MSWLVGSEPKSPVMKVTYSQLGGVIILLYKNYCITCAKINYFILFGYTICLTSFFTVFAESFYSI